MSFFTFEFALVNVVFFYLGIIQSLLSNFLLMLLYFAFLQLRVLSSVQVRGALETLLGALTPIDHGRAQKTEVHAALMNSDLLSRETENITLLLSLLVRAYSIFIN